MRRLQVTADDLFNAYLTEINAAGVLDSGAESGCTTDCSPVRKITWCEDPPP
jgi:hypothetical protein